jgi:hypothetical protein
MPPLVFHTHALDFSTCGLAFDSEVDLLTTNVCCRYSKKCSQKVLAAVDPSLSKDGTQYSKFEI